MANAILGAHWLSTNLRALPVGIDREGLSGRSRTCSVLLHHHDGVTYVGSI